MNNNQPSGDMIVAIVFLAVAYYVALFLFALAAFVCAILSALAVVAWIKPFRLFGEDFTREEGRGFIIRGVAGYGLFLAFADFAAWMYDFTITQDTYRAIAFSGYATGSMWVGYVLEEQREQATATKEQPSPYPTEILPPHVPPVEPRPFHYASWDDEDERR